MDLNELQSLLPILSLVVAALAVFVGPFISWNVAKRQSDVSVRIANKQIIAPMRQAWINNLRDLLAEILGKCAHYWSAGYEEREDSEYRHITELIQRLELYINPKEEDHSRLVKHVKSMEAALSKGSSTAADKEFWEAHSNSMMLAQSILKREWDRTRNEI